MVRCDGSPEIGLGHVVRCVALADELHHEHGWQIMFVMREGPLAFEVVKEKGYLVEDPITCGPPVPYGVWLQQLSDKVGAQILILDVREDFPRAAVQAFRNQGLLVVTLDDPTDRRLETDLAFYPPIPQLKKMDWAGFTGQLHSGWEWVVLRREFSSQPPKPANSPPKILVSMGGSDPAGMTLKAVSALERLHQNFTGVIILGQGFRQLQALEHSLDRARHSFEVRRNVTRIWEEMAQADLAIGSFGVTAYELAAMGIPALLLSLTSDHAESASAFSAEGMAVNLGVHEQVSENALAEEIAKLLEDRPRRVSMGRKARETIDGAGAARVVRVITSAIKERNDCCQSVA